jgi:hypothetical protein
MKCIQLIVLICTTFLKIALWEKYLTSRVPHTGLGHNFPSGLNKIKFTPEL